MPVSGHDAVCACVFGGVGPLPAHVVRSSGNSAYVNATVLGPGAQRRLASAGSTCRPSTSSTLPSCGPPVDNGPCRTVTSSKPLPAATANAAHTDDGTLLYAMANPLPGTPPSMVVPATDTVPPHTLAIRAKPSCGGTMPNGNTPCCCADSGVRAP